MPVIDVSKLTGKYPVLLADYGNLPHGIGWQRHPESPHGACFLIAKNSLLGGPKVLERFPLTETGWAKAWLRLLELDRDAAQTIIRRLEEREAARSNAVSGTVLPKRLSRVPSNFGGGPGDHHAAFWPSFSLAKLTFLKWASSAARSFDRCRWPLTRRNW
jgi:hypothetical protein